MLSLNPSSKLFHAVVLMGCALSPATGCGKTPSAPDDASCGAGDAGLSDGGETHGEAGACDEGWPPTK